MVMVARVSLDGCNPTIDGDGFDRADVARKRRSVDDCNR
jgi:hypothetical protein